MAISARSIFIGLIAVLLIGFGITLYAQAVSTVYQACVSSAGNMYLIGNGYKKTTCAKGETLISWNSQGPQGIKGDKGDTGNTGPQGEQGPVGPTGLKGEPGTTPDGAVVGPVGPVGPQGVPGEQGVPGPTLDLYDANGQNVGLLVSADNGQAGRAAAFTIYLQHENVLIHLNENRNTGNSGNITFEFPASSVSFFERDCQGPAYSPPYLGLGVPPVALFVGTRSFKWVIGTPVLQAQSVSDLFVGAGCVNNDNGSTTTNFYPVAEFTTPFTLPLAGPLEIR